MSKNPLLKRLKIHHKKRQKQDLLNKGSLFDRLSCSCLPYLRKILCLFYTFWNTLSKEMRNSNLSRNQKQVHRVSKRALLDRSGTCHSFAKQCELDRLVLVSQVQSKD